MNSRSIVVLQLIADGLTNKEIARELDLSAETIHVECRRIFDEIGADNRAHAVAQGFRQGILK